MKLKILKFYVKFLCTCVRLHLCAFALACARACVRLHLRVHVCAFAFACLSDVVHVCAFALACLSDEVENIDVLC